MESSRPQRAGGGDPADLMASRVCLPDHIVFRSFAAETVVLNLHTGKYHGLNPAAGRMLEVLERSPDVRTAVTRLAEEYEQPVARIEDDLREFCADLLERGLIEVREAGGG